MKSTQTLVICLILVLAAAVLADTTREGTLFSLSGIASQEILPIAGIAIESRSGELHAIHAQAEIGSVEAFYILGLFYLYGWQSLELDEETALFWFKRAAVEGHNDAQCAIGVLLFHGHNQIKADRAAAKSYFQLASNANHSYGHWLLGRLLFQEASTSRKDQSAAASLLRLVADEIPEAAHQLAIMYEYGLVEENSSLDSNLFKARELYEQASRKGSVESIYHLALMYIYGRGVPQDYAVATKLLLKAASNNQRPHVPSMRYLAVIYANGFSHPSGVADYDAALRWYKICAEAATEDLQDAREVCIKEHKALANVVNDARANTVYTSHSNGIS